MKHKVSTAMSRTVLKVGTIDTGNGTKLNKIEYKTHRVEKEHDTSLTGVFTLVFDNGTTLTLTGVRNLRCCEKFTSHIARTNDPTTICSAANTGHIESIGFQNIVITVLS